MFIIIDYCYYYYYYYLCFVPCCFCANQWTLVLLDVWQEILLDSGQGIWPQIRLEYLVGYPARSIQPDI